MNLFSIAAPLTAGGVLAAAEGAASEGGLAINFFWILVASANFLVFAVILYLAFGKQVSGMLAARRERIEQGLRDAEQAKQDRESAETGAPGGPRRGAPRGERHPGAAPRRSPRRPATRTSPRPATSSTRMRERATEEITAEKQRALAELRGEVADLALQAAVRVVRETMTDQRQRRLVEEFLADPSTSSKN